MVWLQRLAELLVVRGGWCSHSGEMDMDRSNHSSRRGSIPLGGLLDPRTSHTGLGNFHHQCLHIMAGALWVSLWSVDCCNGVKLHGKVCRYVTFVPRVSVCV